MRVGFGFSTVTFRPSRVLHSRVFSRLSVDTDVQSSWKLPAFYQTFKMLWQIFSADNVFVRFYFGTLYAVITVHAVEIFHCTIRFINQIPKEVPCETFNISFHFHKIVQENTFALTGEWREQGEKRGRGETDPLMQIPGHALIPPKPLVSPKLTVSMEQLLLVDSSTALALVTLHRPRNAWHAKLFGPCVRT